MIFYHHISPILVSLGSLQIRWYGLMFASGILLSYFFIASIFKKEKLQIADLDSIAVYLFVGLVVGARLGHIIFYNIDYFLQHPLEILAIWKGGLASHGAAIGLFIAYWLWCKRHKMPFSKHVDAIAMGIPIAAMFVRFGNFFNSEIVGIPTSGSWGVIFQQLGEDFPRHPSQLYEAALNIFILILFVWIYKKKQAKAAAISQQWPTYKPYFFLALYLILYFGGRFILEYFKDLHTLPESFPLSMGQVLSILPVLIGFGLLWKGRKQTEKQVS